ncbi:uncharacterized protein LOC124625788 isoform X1 [Schistocerca americana]|uniref:uncharacterized protein LOC124625788 isoform X1 n=1 Tax=Schistocerca americana TaxID=7009 RepID=UPI001F500810|nr:uncharacterized protein LOC124625788 isoform X1 [Schistocerca americana]XP_047096965.1 uncharacterized protein LOC124711124 isoform X1 [Schistocerca piceifrons]XP_049766725.1 uncharacterized protein LOC126100207 isoform X1 [Schistocerca cancellata]XP_049943054.1 uncharacterized protein LOC126419845 isoform X1 [Schistocerca serialis cubense]
MPVTTKLRQSANPVDQATLPINERILRECHNLYTDPDKGLIKIAEQFGLKLLAPRKKIIVLLIGNHSAGKSSFINWYIEEHVQKTGVAIETQGFVIVTSGRKRETLMGNATLHLYPHFKPLQHIPGVVDFLSTEISTSKQKKFSLVTFVDTPGLVDGGMEYPFDVNEAVLWLGKMADLVFVFFDPIGQALCKRTLNLVEALNKTQTEKMRFYLSKADDAGDESDRQRVMMQIVQELCKRPGLNRTGFDMPTIYIPELNKQQTRCANQIENVCKDIERTINQTIQNTLNTLEKDCEAISKLVSERLQKDEEDRNFNYRTSGRAFLLGSTAAFVPFLLFVNMVISLLGEKRIKSLIGSEKADSLLHYMSPVRMLWSFVPEHHQWKLLIVFVLMSVALFFLTKWSIGLRPTLSRKQKNYFTDVRNHVDKVVAVRKQELYREYLMQSVGDQDM